ncbi:hypothetical protein [Streptomyces sp. C8S0]|uniref:hypothetical protein n=1 Tax=Streptomyces sp. C8S0 TaxID=2585716 RepID=UPI00125DC172|nr:hypothetical protein [Streptomyces sp. C8S0]
MYEVTQAAYRFATTDDTLPPGRVVTVEDLPGLATVIVKPGHATPAFLTDIGDQQTSLLATGQWLRLAPGADHDRHPQRIYDVSWRLMPASMFPAGKLCLPMERPGKHTWVIREGEASEQLVREMTELLTRMVRAGVWIRVEGE